MYFLTGAAETKIALVEGILFGRRLICSSSRSYVTCVDFCGVFLLQDADSAKPDRGSSESRSVESGRPKMKGPFTCPMCSKEHNAEEDLIPLSPDEEEAAALLEKALTQQQAKRAAKKQKGQKAEPDDDAPALQPTPLQRAADAKSPPAEQKEKPEFRPPVSATGETTEESIVKRVPAKRLRDWVLESEIDFVASTTKEAKHRQVAAK